MWKNRAGYALAVAALAALVWLFGRPFLVCALVLAAGLPFVQLALPGPGGGMERFGFKSVRELEQSIPRWLSIKIPEQAGRMMQLFRMEHLENRFTRMVTVSAGAPETGLRALANDIGVLSLTVMKDVSEPRAVLLNGVENIEIPAEGDAKINILC